MKKYFLLIFMLAGTFLFAQVNKKVNPKFLKAVAPANYNNREAKSGLKLTQGPLKAHARSQSTCGTIFTSGPNVFGVGGTLSTVRQNCLSYNADLNTVLWTQRASPLWGFSGYTSGAIQATWLNVSTGIWDSMIIYRDSLNGYRARYPGGVFYNTSGNTNLANAYAVGAGPACNTQWSGTWYCSRQVNGNYHSVSSALDSTKFCAYGAAPFGNVAAGNVSLSGAVLDFVNADMQQAGNTVYVGGPLTDVNVSSNFPIYGGTIAKATNLSWSQDTIVPGFYKNSNNEYASDGEGVRLAFSPNGQIGYAVFIGKLATVFNNYADSTLSPIVYKTTNGGATWSSSSILPNYDWGLGHPEMLKNVGVLRSPQPAKKFRLYLNHGIDLTVDSVGTLHLVGTVTDPYLGQSFNSVDSLTYSYPYAWDYVNYHPIIWDMMTDGTTWNTLFVDSIMTAFVGHDPATDTTSTFSSWSDGSGSSLGYGARIQVSRSVTGGKIFYSWADSDPMSTGTVFNMAPDIYMKSYDITNGMVSATANVTQGTQNCFFHYLSDVSYFDSGLGAWVCPIVYTTPRSYNIPFNGIDTVMYNYTNCATFAGSQYTDSASVYRTMGGAGIAGHYVVLNSAVQNYPNPFSQTTTITVDLNRSKNLDLKVFDVIGNLVYTKNIHGNTGGNSFVFDGTSLQAGVYYYTISAGNERITKKMILQK